MNQFSTHSSKIASKKNGILASLQAKVIAMVTLILFVMIIFTVIVWIQNQQTKIVAQRIQQVNFPMTLLINKLSAEINNTTIYTRDYLMSGKQAALNMQQDAWQKNVLPSLDSLKEFKAHLIDKTYDARIDSVLLIANQLRNAQQELIIFHDRNSGLNDFKLTRKDSLSALLLLKKIKNKEIFETTLSEKSNQAAYTLRIKLNELIESFTVQFRKKSDLDFQNLNANLRITNLTITFISFFALLFSAIALYFVLKSFKTSFNKPRKLLNKLAQGELTKEIESPQNEFAEISKAINKLSSKLNYASQFALNIGENKFDFDFVPESEKDVLGNSLLQMRQKLQKVAAEDEKRSWATQGIAQFGELIRSNSSDFSILGDTLLYHLIDYINANQAGIFIASEPDYQGVVSLNMISCFAYNRKKFQQRTVKVFPDYAETLLGQAYLEKEKIHLTEIPEDYLMITSGLGDASPKHLLLIPLKINEKVEGVLELASFDSFENYQIDFIERVCEMLASAITTVKNSENTKQLLQELQYQTESLKSQEEEMRQNMEELSATQDQMQHKQNELELLKANLEIEVQNQTSELQSSLIRFDLINQVASEGLWDMAVPEDGIIHPETEVSWSPQLKKSLGFEENEFPNEWNSWIKRINPIERNEIAAFFTEFIYKDIDFEGEHHLQNKEGEYRWFKFHAKALRDKNGKALRIAGFLNDITYQKELDKAMEDLKENEKMMQNKNAELQTSQTKMEANQQILRKALEKNKEREIEIRETNKALEKNQEQFELLTRNVPGLIYQFESNIRTGKVRFTFASAYVEKIFGLKPAEFQALTTEELVKMIHPDDKKAYFISYTASLQKFVPFQWEGRMLNAHQEWRWLRVTSIPRLVEDKDFIFSEGIFIDITDRKQQEEQIKEMNAQIMASEEELRQNLEEMQAVQEQMNDKQKQLELVNAKLKANELILQKALTKK